MSYRASEISSDVAWGINRFFGISFIPEIVFIITLSPQFENTWKHVFQNYRGFIEFKEINLIILNGFNLKRLFIKFPWAATYRDNKEKCSMRRCSGLV
jgi:hypothetical protein